MKYMEARYDDICHECCGKIKAGEMIWWERKNSRHAKCRPGVVGKWLRG